MPLFKYVKAIRFAYVSSLLVLLLQAGRHFSGRSENIFAARQLMIGLNRSKLQTIPSRTLLCRTTYSSTNNVRCRRMARNLKASYISQSSMGSAILPLSERNVGHQMLSVNLRARRHYGAAVGVISDALVSLIESCLHRHLVQTTKTFYWLPMVIYS